MMGLGRGLPLCPRSRGVYAPTDPRERPLASCPGATAVRGIRDVRRRWYCSSSSSLSCAFSSTRCSSVLRLLTNPLRASYESAPHLTTARSNLLGKFDHRFLYKSVIRETLDQCTPNVFNVYSVSAGRLEISHTVATGPPTMSWRDLGIHKSNICDYQRRIKMRQNIYFNDTHARTTHARARTRIHTHSVMPTKSDIIYGTDQIVVNYLNPLK